jgi:hypothetical protein
MTTMVRALGLPASRARELSHTSSAAGVMGHRGKLSLGTIVSELNAALGEFSFTLRPSNSETTGDAFLSYVNTVPDFQSTDNVASSDPSPRILRAMLQFLKENGCVCAPVGARPPAPPHLPRPTLLTSPAAGRWT